MLENWHIWLGFHVFLFGMLALDLGVFHRRPHAVSLKEALTWTFVWIGLALLFNVGVYFFQGSKAAGEFFAGYLIEKSLSVDNLFVFVLIFTYFKVPESSQHKVLFWGIVGALLMRAGFIFAGISLIQKFHWMIYLFGGFLIYTGVKMAFAKDAEVNPDQNFLLRCFRRMMPISREFDGANFFTRIDGRLHATPLFLALLFVEFTDIVFAIDSIPAIMGITLDPFLVYTSNVMAILGMRSLYFALAGMVGLFCYLHYGLSAVLAFVGLKMVLADIFPVPLPISLGVIVSILAISVIASLARPTAPKRREEPAPQPRLIASKVTA